MRIKVGRRCRNPDCELVPHSRVEATILTAIDHDEMIKYGL